MPLYEYHCQTCRRRFTLLVRTFEPPHAPPCEYCHSPATERLVSRVALLRSDESRMQALADPSNLAGLDESDPVSMGRWMRRMGQAMGDEPAGKRVFGGGQIGYSRQLYKSDRNELLAELGYDFSFVVFAKDDAVPHEIFIHSLRAFLGYNLTLSKDTALNTGLEGLFNLNTFNSPNDQAESVSRGVFEDTRINFKTALTTTIYKRLSFRFSFKLRFDNVPAPRPAPAGTEFVGQFAPLAEKLDTLSEAALVVNFL